MRPKAEKRCLPDGRAFGDAPFALQEVVCSGEAAPCDFGLAPFIAGLRDEPDALVLKVASLGLAGTLKSRAGLRMLAEGLLLVLRLLKKRAVLLKMREAAVDADMLSALAAALALCVLTRGRGRSAAHLPASPAAATAMSCTVLSTETAATSWLALAPWFPAEGARAAGLAPGQGVVLITVAGVLVGEGQVRRPIS